jgi:hypothetical protein
MSTDLGDRLHVLLGPILAVSIAFSENAAAEHASREVASQAPEQTSSDPTPRAADDAKAPSPFDSSRRVVGEAALGSILGIGGIVGGIALGAGTSGSSTISSMLILGSLGGFSGFSVGVWGAGELSDGRGDLAQTALGTLGGIVGGGLLALPIVLLNLHSEDKTPGTIASCAVFLGGTLTGSVVGYELSQPGHRSGKALLLPIVGPRMAGVTLVGTLD